MTVRSLPPEDEWRTHEAIRCLECGAWKSALGRHLTGAHGMTAGEYRAAWGMRQRQPLTAGYLSQVRREIANSTGGPDRMRALVPKVADQAARARQGRERRPQESVSLRVGQQRWWDRSHADAVARAVASARARGHLDVGAYLRVRYLDDQQSIRVLCAELGVSKGVVLGLMDASGIGPRGPGPIRETREAKIVRLYRAGMSMSRIAGLLQVGYIAMARALDAAKVERRIGRPTRSKPDADAVSGFLFLDDNDFVTREEASTLLGVAPRTVTGWVAAGRLSAQKGGRLLKVRVGDVRRLLAGG